jgi:hypothetical protein
MSQISHCNTLSFKIIRDEGNFVILLPALLLFSLVLKTPLTELCSNDVWSWSQNNFVTGKCFVAAFQFEIVERVLVVVGWKEKSENCLSDFRRQCLQSCWSTYVQEVSTSQFLQFALVARLFQRPSFCLDLSVVFIKANIFFTFESCESYSQI